MGITKITLGTIFCYIMVFTACALASTEKEYHPTPRNSLYYMNIPSGLEFSIRSPAPGSLEPQTLEVQAMLAPDKDMMKAKWVINKITTVPFLLDIRLFYALVNVKEDRIFIFFIWNGRYCIINKKNGAILKRGRGDKVLKQYDQFVLLKLIATSTFGRVIKEEKGVPIQRPLQQENEKGKKGGHSTF